MFQVRFGLNDGQVVNKVEINSVVQSLPSCQQTKVELTPLRVLTTASIANHEETFRVVISLVDLDSLPISFTEPNINVTWYGIGK